MRSVWRRASTFASMSALAGGVSVMLACTRGEPPTPPGSPSVALLGLPVSSTADAAVSGLALGPTPPPLAPQPAQSSTAETPGVSRLALEQTREKPTASGQAFESRRDALWDAIVTDDPERAMPFFFPLEAYQQVKDIGDPAADWRRRLVAAYKHDIHELHAKLGDAAAQAHLVTMTVPGDRTAWVDPGEEWNKVGYYRVYGSKLHFSTPDRESDQTFDVKSLISWRGEWFVVHLSAIK